MRNGIVALIAVSSLFTLADGCERISTPPRHAQMPTRTDALPPEYSLTTPKPSADAANDVDSTNLAPTVPLTDAQIAGVTEAANWSELEVSHIAQRKAVTPEVQRFAALMISHHEEAQREQARLGIESVASPVSERLEAHAQSAMDLLMAATASDFDRMYIDTQVEAQQRVLHLIDSQLLPNVQDVALKAYIENIRIKVEAHLHQAQTARESLSALAIGGHTTGPSWRD